MKTNALSLILISLLTCFAALRPAEAVNPPPDGDYGRGNTAEGLNALSAGGGSHNTAIGASALQDNTFGIGNTATGYQTLVHNTIGNDNTAIGTVALRDNTTGSENTATGWTALFNNTTGSRNTAAGTSALTRNTTGNNNTAEGFQALWGNTTGSSNTATGIAALHDNTTGSQNTATGLSALIFNSTGNSNTAVGFQALYGNIKGNSNTAIGELALDNTTGSFNVALGAGAGSGVTTANDVICIGRAVAGVNVSGTCFIGNIRGVTTQNANAVPVVIDGAGQLGTVASSERFKKDITAMEKASEGILSLRPVTFHYKTDGENTPQFGLIAEEVAKVNPALVVPDKEGKPYTVRYEAVNAMLLNEFLKEHAKVEQLKKDFGSKIAEQQKQIEALTTGLQKVSAQLAVSKPAPHTVLNNQ